MTTLESLAKYHDYYCHNNNYYSNEAARDFETWEAFYDEYKDCDIDLNLCFRFDIKKNDAGLYYGEFFIIQQRKGIFTPITVASLQESNVPEIKEYLQGHFDKLKAIWNPFQ